MSHFAQFGLLLITVGGLYFTVLPLYQNALLAEAIAKKELELKAMNEVLALTYQRVRIAAVQEFHLRATHECTILWRQSPLPESMGGPPAPKKSAYESALEFDTRECLGKVTRLPQVAADLTPEDRAALSELVETAASRIDVERNIGVAKFQNAPRTITQEKADSMEMPGFRARALQLRADWLGTEAVSRERLQLAVSLEQEEAATAFENVVRTAVLAIKLPEVASAPGVTAVR